MLNEFYKQNVAMPVAKSMIDRLKKEYENELMKRNIGMNFGQLQKKVLNEYEIKIRGHC